jgi:hypothetical protein
MQSVLNIQELHIFELPELLLQAFEHFSWLLLFNRCLKLTHFLENLVSEESHTSYLVKDRKSLVNDVLVALYAPRSFTINDPFIHFFQTHFERSGFFHDLVRGENFIDVTFRLSICGKFLSLAFYQ